jgi:acetyl-CoA carboxylase biotin carboxyl carrier protein
MSENIGSAKAKEQNKGQTRASGKKGGSPKKTAQVSEPSLNMAELQELANLVDEHGFTDFEFENENIRVRLSKNSAPQIIQAAQQYAPPIAVSSAPVQSASASTENKSETVAAETSADEDLHTITSPIVGTFYRSPAPDKEPYVKEGSNVSPDTIVCIVEAMKLMNEIEAEVAGEVVKVYVESGQPVEYGQPLFGIKK